MTQEMAHLVHDIGITVKYAGQYFAFAYTAFYILQRIGCRKGVAGIHEHQVIARSTVDALVHGIIKSLVGL